MEVEYPNVYKTHATFRLWGKYLNPLEVTRQLGLAPSYAHAPGEVRQSGKVWDRGHWDICSEGHVDSKELTVHITWLLDQLEPVAAQLAVLRSGPVQADIFCLWMLQYSQGGITLDPDLLDRLAVLDLALGLDIYKVDLVEDQIDPS